MRHSVETDRSIMNLFLSNHISVCISDTDTLLLLRTLQSVFFLLQFHFPTKICTCFSTLETSMIESCFSTLETSMIESCFSTLETSMIELKLYTVCRMISVDDYFFRQYDLLYFFLTSRSSKFLPVANNML